MLLTDNLKTCRVFWRFDQFRNLSGDIPAQSRMRLGGFFSENPQIHPGAKMLM